MKANVQRVGAFLASMVMPNLGAFIAWGLITAMFIPTGWIPNAHAAELVGPMITYLLPLLIGYTGGRIVHGQRGAVVGAVATMGVAVGSDVPMFLGAMIVAPVSALILKYVDRALQERVPTGFEMLVDNFTAGILGGLMSLAGLFAIGLVVEKVANAAGHAVDFLVDHSLLPLAAVVIEPAKVLFLNNAVNHGVLGPLGVAEAAKSGKSILFMLESNPGPGLGVLLAYLFFGPRPSRLTVPGAIIIHFLGGIHEIYFPYILMKPKMILAPICGSAVAILIFLATGAGLVATPAPGSIFAYAAVTPKGGWFGVFTGVFVAAAVSFAVGSVLLGLDGGRQEPARAEPRRRSGRLRDLETGAPRQDEVRSPEPERFPPPEAAPAYAPSGHIGDRVGRGSGAMPPPEPRPWDFRDTAAPTPGGRHARPAPVMPPPQPPQQPQQPVSWFEPPPRPNRWPDVAYGEPPRRSNRWPDD